MDSEKKGMFTKIAEKVRLRAVNKMVRTLEQRRVTVEDLIEDALYEDPKPTPEEFRVAVVEALKQMYESRLTGLKRTDEEIEKEADKIVASYEYRKDHPDEKKEEDINNVNKLEKQMDVILGIYDPMINELEGKSKSFIEKLGIAADDAAEIEITKDSFDPVLSEGKGLLKSISDLSYLVETVRFKDVVKFSELNTKYKDLTGKDYAESPSKRFKEAVFKFYTKIQVHLNVLERVLNEKAKDLEKNGIELSEIPEIFAEIESFKKKLHSYCALHMSDGEISRDIKKELLDELTLETKVAERVAKVKIAKAKEEEPPSEEPPKPEEEEPTEESKKTPWYKAAMEKFKGIMPVRGKDGKKRDKRVKKDKSTPSSVIITKLTEEKRQELVDTYKAKVSEYNTKVSKLNDLNVSLKALYGGLTAGTVEEIYAALKSATFVASYEEIARVEGEARKLNQEMSSVEIDVINARVEYLGGTGKSITSLEDTKDLALQQPKGILEETNVIDFIVGHDKSKLVIEHRLNEIATELADASITPEAKTALEAEKARLEKYFISENSIITRAAVEACRADRFLSIDKINEQRKDKIQAIKDEINAKLVTRRTPEPPKPTLEELLVTLSIKDLIENIKVSVPTIYDELEAKKDILVDNIAVIKAEGLLTYIDERSYKMLIDPNFKDKLAYLKTVGLHRPIVMSSFTSNPYNGYNEVADISLDEFKVKLKESVETLIKDRKDTLGYDFMKMEDMTYGRILTFVGFLDNATTFNLFDNNLKIIKELGLEDHMYEKKYQQLLISTKLKDKYQALFEKGVSVDDIKSKWLDKLFDETMSVEDFKTEVEKSMTTPPPGGDDKPKTEEEKRQEILEKFKDLKSYYILEKESLESLKLLLDVPESVVRANDKFIDEKSIAVAFELCTFLSCVDLKEKFDYIHGLSVRNSPYIIIDSADRLCSFEDFKKKCEEITTEFIKVMKDEYGLDVTKCREEDKGMFLNYQNSLSNERKRERFRRNLESAREVFSDEEILDKIGLESLLVSPVKEFFQNLKDEGLTNKEIYDNFERIVGSKSEEDLAETIKAIIAARTKVLTPEEEKQAILEKFKDLKSYPKLEKEELGNLKLLLDVPESVVRANDEYIYKYISHIMSNICSFLSCVDLKEKHEYIRGLNSFNSSYLVIDIADRLCSFEDFKKKCEEKTLDFINEMKDKYNLDVTKCSERDKSKFLNLQYELSVGGKRNRFERNLDSVREIFTDEEIFERHTLEELVEFNIKIFIKSLIDNGLTEEEIKTNYTRLYEALYAEDGSNDKLFETIIAIKAARTKVLTPEEEKQAILEKFKDLGLPELEKCSLKDLKKLTEVDESLVIKNAEFIKRSDLFISSMSICDYLTCVDLEEKVNYLTGPEKINIYEIITKTKDLKFDEFKAHFDKETQEFVEEINKTYSFDITKCKNINHIELIKLGMAYKLELNKKVFATNLSELRALFTDEEIYERFEASDLFAMTISANIRYMRSNGLSDEEIKANYELLTLISPENTELNKKIEEIKGARKVTPPPGGDDKPKPGGDDTPPKEEPKLDGDVKSEAHIELGRLRFAPGKYEEADRPTDTIEKNIPMLGLEIYKNGIRVELYNDVKNQLKKLQVKVALVGKNKNGEWSKRPEGGMKKIKPGESIDLVKEDFDPEEYALAVQSSYVDGENVSEHKDTIKLR